MRPEVRPLTERSFEFAVRLVELCGRLEGRGRGAGTIALQLLRSGTSIGANVEEGQASQSEADFLSKYSIACKEARETHDWLRLVHATELDTSNEVQDLLDECNRLVAILTTIVRKLKHKRRN